MRLLRSRRRTSSFAVTEWYASRDPGAQHPHPVWHVRISCGGPEVAPAEGASTLTTVGTRHISRIIKVHDRVCDRAPGAPYRPLMRAALCCAVPSYRRGG